MNKAKLFEDRKFMWDGRTYESESEASKIKEEYVKNKFKTHLVQEDNKYYLFTQRVVTEVKVDSQY